MRDAGDRSRRETRGRKRAEMRDTRGKIRLKLHYGRQPGLRVDAFYRLPRGIALEFVTFSRMRAVIN